MTDSRQAIVTGASSGIGRAVTERFLASGWAVTGLSRRRPERLGDGYRHISVDLSDRTSLAAALENEAAPDALVHAAGILRVGPLENFDLEAGADMWRLHVDTAAWLIGRFAPDMQPGGRIVMIGSRVATGAAGRALYAASKSALAGLVRSVAAEVVSRGITVNIVAPGATDTEMLRDPARASERPRVPPLGRLVQPGEVAGTVAFLCSPDAGAITGQSITICGGGSL